MTQLAFAGDRQVSEKNEGMHSMRKRALLGAGGGVKRTRLRQPRRGRSWLRPPTILEAHRLQNGSPNANVARVASETVECPNHGSACATFVCKHVADGEGLGFVYDQNAREPWPDAVCNACATEPPWSDETAMERIRLLCSRCWDAAFERNANVIAASEHEWFRRTFERTTQRQERWKKEFSINSFKRYQYCFDPGQAWLAFGDADGFRVRCDAHVIGSFSPTSETWLWGWANDHWEARVTEAIVAVKRRGEREGVRSLTRSTFQADEADAWNLACAVLDTLPELQAVYRSPGNASLFLAIAETRWVS